MVLPLMLVFFALVQAAPAKDPHAGRFTTGTGRRCTHCHDKTNPAAEDQYRAAARMEKMAADLSRGPLKPYGGVTCFTCHRGGGPNHNRRSPWPLDRRDVQRMVNEWPGDRRDSEAVTRSMSEYSVSLGVKCDYCHVPGNWKNDNKASMKTTRVMIRVMDEFPKYFKLANAAAFTCFTCHQGAAKIRR